MGQQAIVNQAAFDIGQMADRLAQGYFMHLAAIQVAKDPRAVALSPSVEPGSIVPVAYVGRKDGTRHVFTLHISWPKREAIRLWSVI
jgi:hypothetical protein